MRSALLRWAPWLPAVSLAVLAGCASAPKTLPADAAVNGPWSGRLALQVKDNPSGSFAAMFELKGSARAGELTLSTPVGSTLAVVAWTPESATLRSNGQVRQAESVDALVAQATGSAIPVAALFDWLRGINTQVPGWRVDLSQLAQGRLGAVRLEPPPEADLRVALDH
jgi:outer membrane lipoprotein LolB